jgi:hypothetical protein
MLSWEDQLCGSKRRKPIGSSEDKSSMLMSLQSLREDRKQLWTHTFIVQTNGFHCDIYICAYILPQLWLAFLLLSLNPPPTPPVLLRKFYFEDELNSTLPQACNPSYLGGWDWEDHGSRPAWANISWDPISKITRAKWMIDCGSSCSVPALQARSPEFKKDWGTCIHFVLKVMTGATEGEFL